MNNVDRYAWAPEEIRALLLHVNGKLSIKCKECGKVRATSGKGQVLERFKSGYELCWTSLAL